MRARINNGNNTIKKQIKTARAERKINGRSGVGGAIGYKLRRLTARQVVYGPAATTAAATVLDTR